jgi:hypothetical protein
MNCPKCGAVQDAAREDCSSCGIIFARWQPRRERTAPGFTPAPVEPQQTSSGVPPSVVIAVAVVILIFGLVWTSHNRAAREKSKGDDILNQINVEGLKKREQLQQEAAAARRAEARTAHATLLSGEAHPSYPPDLDETAVRKIIEGCSYFQDRVTVEIPKQFQVNLYGSLLDRYPSLPAAAFEHLIEFDPPFDIEHASRRLSNPAQPGETIKINLAPFTHRKIDVTDTADAYQFVLGRRRVDTITSISKTSDSTVGIGFNWKYEESEGNALDRAERSCGADLQRTSSGWAAAHIWRNTRSASQAICQ